MEFKNVSVGPENISSTIRPNSEFDSEIELYAVLYIETDLFHRMNKINFNSIAAIKLDWNNIHDMINYYSYRYSREVSKLNGFS